MDPVLLDLPGPSRRIRVEPLRLPEPRREPEPGPRAPLPAGPEREHAPAEPEPVER